MEMSIAYDGADLLSSLDDSRSRIKVPVLFIAGVKDSVLLPSMSKGMEEHIPRLRRREVNAGHWALWEDSQAVNQHLKDWFTDVVFKSNSKI